MFFSISLFHCLICTFIVAASCPPPPGTPKGVLVHHGGLTNYVLWLARYLGLGSTDRWLASINAAFDPSLYEVLAPLSVGGTVVFFDRPDPIDTVAMVAAIRKFGITGMTAGFFFFFFFFLGRAH